jgi:uncharacterized cupredoxin-like copper-binding protein
MRLLAAATAAALLLAACGADEAPKADRTIKIEMVDTAFEPLQLSVKAGETVRFVFVNLGKSDHEAVIGDEEVQTEHGAGGHHGGDKAPNVQVPPGKSGDLVHTFDEPGSVLIGCHVPGHWQAGMRIDVTVT